jgi:hypothetical protein
LFYAVNVSFPEKKDYDYASETSDPAGSAGEARQRYRDVRDQAAQEVAAAIDQYERGGQQPDLEQQRGAAGPRGSFTPSDLITDQDGNPVNLIQIFEKADPTTFLHESGHFWLEQLKADALAVGGGLQQDFKTVTDWWASRPLELREEAVKRAKKAKDKASVAERERDEPITFRPQTAEILARVVKQIQFFRGLTQSLVSASFQRSPRRC